MTVIWKGFRLRSQFYDPSTGVLLSLHNGQLVITVMRFEFTLSNWISKKEHERGKKNLLGRVVNH